MSTQPVKRIKKAVTTEPAPRARKIARAKVKAQAVYVVARGVAGRPTCQHKLAAGEMMLTACGTNIFRWSLQYTNVRLEAILCRRAQCRAE